MLEDEGCENCKEEDEEKKEGDIMGKGKVYMKKGEAKMLKDVNEENEKCDEL